MHLIFRPFLPAPQSQKPQRSPATPAFLLNRSRQTCPKSERLNIQLVIAQALNHSRMAGWRVIGSDVIDLEIGKMPDYDKRSKVQIFSTLRDTQIKVDAGIEQRAVELQKLGLKTLDALHVSCAEKAKADVFLTTDDHLLSKSAQNKKILKVSIENPLRWVTEVLK